MNRVIDVSIATRNSSRTIRKCLEAIRSNVPYRKIIVVDAGSTDRTVQICKNLGAEVMQEQGYLGKVRYAQAYACDTEWVAYVDSDVYIYPEWWSEVAKYMDDKEVGLIMGLHDQPLSNLKVFDHFLWFLWTKGGAVALNNTLVRRNLILDCKEELVRTHAGEDWVIVSHMIGKGMKNVVIKRRLCFHDQDPYEHQRFAAFRWGQSMRIKYGFSGPYYGGLHDVLHNTFRWCIFTAETKRINLKLLIYLLHLSAWTIIGFFFPKRRYPWA